MLDTNLKGAWLMAQETARHMVRLGHGGSIVNIASVLGLKAEKQVIGYAASKAGLVHLTRALALELARYRIRVNAICPGYLPSEMTEEYLSGPKGEGLIRRIPQRRIGAHADLEGPLLLLASDAGAYMTGSVLGRRRRADAFNDGDEHGFRAAARDRSPATADRRFRRRRDHAAGNGPGELRRA